MHRVENNIWKDERGYWFTDETIELYGPYTTKEEAIEASDKYNKEVVG